ncbi:MAG: hypothetical protein WA667_08300, partial [Candidatus Nitrosopolaris sp.]
HKGSTRKINAFITLLYPSNKIKFKISKSRTSTDFIETVLVVTVPCYAFPTTENFSTSPGMGSVPVRVIPIGVSLLVWIVLLSAVGGGGVLLNTSTFNSVMLAQLFSISNNCNSYISAGHLS